MGIWPDIRQADELGCRIGGYRADARRTTADSRAWAVSRTVHNHHNCTGFVEECKHPVHGRRLLQVRVEAASEGDFRAWEGWCHSRFRQLVMLLQSQVPPWLLFMSEDSGNAQAYSVAVHAVEGVLLPSCR